MNTALSRLRGAAVRTAGSLALVRPLIQRVGGLWGQSAQFRDLYSKDAPTPATAFEIFQNEWSSCVPGFEAGKSKLFEDERIRWLELQLGSFQGKRVLELGPLEGGHTTMMERAGAEIVSIEANQRSFLKCLVVKNALHLKTEFLYGDFCRYLAAAPPRSFDFVLASGVLYHMKEPLKLLHEVARVGDALGVWTHYYDASIIGATPRFDPHPQLQVVDGKTVEVYRQNYLFSVAARGFCGGSAPTSYWLTRTGLLDYVRSLGFEVCVGAEDLRHPGGPCILFFAKRTV
jgi:SAM-dependent methyltransferase